MTAPARRAALAVLNAVHDGRSDLPEALDRTRGRLQDPRDRALAVAIAVGTLRWRARLDHAIAQVASRPLARIEPEILDILRLAAYQLQHLERVPPYAVLHDAVALAHRAGKHGAAPFVNAVLRALTDKAVAFPPRPPRSPDTTRADRDAALNYLSVTQSHPRWLVERWLDRHGFDAVDRWTAFNNTVAPITIRANTRRIATEDLVAQFADENVVLRVSRWSTKALVVERGNPLTSRLANQGLFWVQDEASQLVAELVDIKPGERVLDACSAPGNKALVFAETMQHRGTLVAADRRAARIQLLARHLGAMGADCATVLRSDACQPALRASFDCVIVDAPCSGLGTLRRDPDIKWRRQADDLGQLSDYQTRLLNGVQAVVRPGGRLYYAVCSLEPEEADQVIDRFLDTHPDFERDHPRSPHVARFVDDAGTFRTVPERDELEGFFAVMLRRAAA